MRKLLLAAAAILALGAAPALADEAAVAVGGTAGAATGATAGFFIAGPIGAVVGGAIGAGVGSSVSASAEDYARSHEVASVEYRGEIRPGYRVGHGLHLYAVPTDPDYSYVYVNGHPVLIENSSGTVVWVGE
ncbi:MAG: DUF1236 domain-containing protein [Devosia sp.]|jgi:hypothetical protein